MNAPSESSGLPPTFSELLDYAEGRLSGAGQQRVAEFLAAHPREVAADWAWVQDFLKKSQSVQLHAMPEGLEERLNRIHQANPAETPLKTAGDWLEKIRRVVAELVDPGPAAGFAAAGLRAKPFEDTARQWVFKTAQCDIWINALARPDEHYDVHGQIFPVNGEAGITSGSAQLLDEDRECGLATVDGFGEFVIRGVPTGDYALVILCGDAEIVCSPMTIDS